MLIVRKVKLPAIIAGGIVAALLIFAAAATGMPDTRTASAQSTPPGNVTVRNSSNAGEAVVTWEQASGAQGYRIGWVNYQAVLQAVEDGIPWTERFAYTDVRSSVDSHAIPNLMGGEQYAFIVGTRLGAAAHNWSDWQFYTMPAAPVCPDSATQHPPAAPATPTPGDQSAKPTIVFGDLNWSSALLQNRIAQYIVEKGYGYPTDLKFGATLPLFEGLYNGDTHVAMEIWLPNQNAAWNEARADGSVISLGQSLSNDWQSAFVIPSYLQQQYPELDSVEDLKDPRYRRLFATPETGGKARLVSCVIGWACTEVNARQVEGYGLLDYVQLVNPADSTALNADLHEAYEWGEPWLGYQWGTNEPALTLELVRLEEPPYSDQCWYTTGACAYQDATILIAANPDLPAIAPDVVAMLRKWDFNIEVYKEMARWQKANPDADIAATAIWWLNTRHDIWGQWVTGDARVSIIAALASGEEAHGWPDD